MTQPSITRIASHQKGLNSPAAEMQNNKAGILIVIAEKSSFVKEAEII
jgi:hypothetical protein